MMTSRLAVYIADKLGWLNIVDGKLPAEYLTQARELTPENKAFRYATERIETYREVEAAFDELWKQGKIEKPFRDFPITKRVLFLERWEKSGQERDAKLISDLIHDLIHDWFANGVWISAKKVFLFWK